MAQVTLKDSLTYTIHNRTFIKGQPQSIMGSDLAYFRNNAHFEVLEDPKPVAPRRAVVAKPAPESEETVEETVEEEMATEEVASEEVPSGDVSEEELAVAEAEEQPAPVKPKAPPAVRKGQFQKGGKRA